jgi:serine/threonine-protein kinase
MVKLFYEEARITAALWHSNVGQVHDLNEEHGTLYSVMEFIPGANLREVSEACAERDVPIPIGFTCYVIAEAALGLHYAHHFSDAVGTTSPIIHRDVSPRNIMVSYEGAVKVIDFGIAKASAGHAKAVMGSGGGTRGYRSPEHVEGNDLDARSDLFSLGMVAHEMLTGTRLLNATSTTESFEQLIIKDEIPSHSLLSAGVPESISAVVMRTLSKGREERWGTGRELAKAIRGAVGPLLFDEDQTAAFMRDLFAQRMQAARALLGSHFGEVEGIRAAAQGLCESLSPKSTQGPGTGASSLPSTARPADIANEGTSPALSIFAVDDSPTILLIVERTLKAAGYRVKGFTSPQAALSSFDQEMPDLVVLDVMMPELTGFELCRRLREKKTSRYVPILFLSSACALEERVESLTVGGDDFIRKPVEPEELVARVRLHLQRVATLQGMTEKH